MRNRFLLLGMLGAVGWLVASIPPPVNTAEPLPASARAVASTPSVVPAGRNPHLEARQAPVPLLRVSPAPAASPATATSTSTTPPDQPAEDELGRRAAKTAAEVDGYRKASIVGRTTSGAWRVKAYRGTTEVFLVVDGTGRVSME